jgi:hypothetical protein
MQFTSNPDWTGEIGMMPPEWQKIYGSMWRFTPDQWKIVCRVVTKAMLSAGPPTEPDNVLPPGSGPQTGYIPPPQVVPAAAMLVNALMLDPYKTYGSVPWASNIHWANYACIAVFFHWLSDEGKQMFANDIKTGNVNRWIPAVRDIAMANCPQAVWSDVGIFSAHLIMEIDTHPFVDFADETWQEARIGTPFAKSDKSNNLVGGLPSLPLDMFCQPFPTCMLEGLFGTGSQPAEVNPVSGRVEYKQQSPYPSSPAAGEPATGCANPQGRLEWGAAIGGALGLGAALLLGGRLTGSIVGIAGGAIAGAVVGSMTGMKGCLQVADNTV